MLPKPFPCVVIDTDPRVNEFNARSALKVLKSTEQQSVKLPTRSPAVTIARRDPCIPWPDMQLTDVCDTQSVTSHPVCPDRIRPVFPSAFPRPVPCTVTEARPPARRFNTVTVLGLETSIENTSEILPDRSPAVTTTRRVPDTPCPTLHLIDVSDTHSVASHPVCPFRP